MHTASDVSDSEVLARAGRAVALCCHGETESGLDLYRQVLSSKIDPSVLSRLPVAIHLRLLEDAHQPAAAAAVRQLALAAGLNVNMSAALGRAPAQIVAEYRDLFARGIINSRMIAACLAELNRSGGTGDLTHLADVERLVRRTTVSMADKAADAQAYWDDLAAWLLTQRSDDTWQEKVQSVRDMHFIRLRGQADDRVRALEAMLTDHVGRYLAELGAIDPLLRAWIPDRFRVSTWALISSGLGYNTPHIHPKGCVTGVLYVAAPDESGSDGDPAGALRIGAPGDRVGRPAVVVAPRPGTLVLMPSYLTHWTRPLGRPGLRISIAFDVMDASES